MNCFLTADLFLFPTLESAGFVILEAMSNYLPVVALNYGGPKQFIRENINHQLVSSDLSIEEIEDQLANKILELYKNSELRIKIGLANFKTVADNFTWENKVRSILNIYENLTQKQDLE
jgi:spore coat protein SA